MDFLVMHLQNLVHFLFNL